MTTVNWIGGNGDWNTAGNWSTDTVPGPQDNAVIAGGYTVTITASISVGSIALGRVRRGSAYDFWLRRDRIGGERCHECRPISAAGWGDADHQRRSHEQRQSVCEQLRHRRQQPDHRWHADQQRRTVRLATAMWRRTVAAQDLTNTGDDHHLWQQHEPVAVEHRGGCARDLDRHAQYQRQRAAGIWRHRPDRHHRQRGADHPLRPASFCRGGRPWHRRQHRAVRADKQCRAIAVAGAGRRLTTSGGLTNGGIWM